MGQNISLNLSFFGDSNKKTTDLSLQADGLTDKTMVLVIIKPFYIVNKIEFDDQIDCGHDELNEIVTNRITEDKTGIKNLFQEYCILHYLYKDHKN